MGLTAAIGLAPATAQTLTTMSNIDAPFHDGQRSTWTPTGRIAQMVGSTLVGLDFDGKTVVPYLAKSWEMSPDGKTYTFHLRDDVTFCSGKKFTADDVVYTFTRLKAPTTRAPFGWRAGEIKELRAKDPYTVEYELKEGFSDLPLQLTMFTNTIINKDTVEALGKDYGTKGIDGTGPWCLDSWRPRTETVLKRHDAYKWGPANFKNRGPVKFERLVHKIIPEESSRVAAVLGGQIDFTDAFPATFMPQAKANPNLNVEQLPATNLLLYFGFKANRPMVSDPRVREAMVIGINRAEIARGTFLGNADPAMTYVNPEAPDYNPATMGLIREDVERAKKLLDEAGWMVGSDGIREKDGVKLAPQVYFTAAGNSVRAGEAIQGYLRRIGVDWRLNAFDSTVAMLKMAEQDYELWSVTVPYISAGDLMSLYFDSRNIPTPNRMNWRDQLTDDLLAKAKGALTAADRTKYFGEVQTHVMKNHLWIPVTNMHFHAVSHKRIKNVRGHPLYAIAFYKGLDFSR
jgi:peptide/nickel transport system substrate-binding protein